MADNAAAFAALDEQISRLRAVPGLAKEMAPAVAEAFQEELHGQIQRGEAPDGTPWVRRDDGGRPLRNAEQSTDVKAVGAVIVARVTGHHAFHHRGQTRGNVVRQILPSRGLTDPFTRAIKRAVELRLGEHFGGGRGR